MARAVVFVIFAAISGYAQTISGTVVDSQKIPIPDATVSLIVEMGGCPSTVTSTGTNGRFQFSNAQPGRYRVKAAKIGYVTQEFGERRKRTPGFGATILLTPSTPNAEIEIVLFHGSEIRGTVYEEQGRPLAEGYVFFEDPERPSQSFFARTDGNGSYRVTDLPAGKYYVSARRFSPQANQVVGDLWYYPGITDKKLASLVTLGENPASVDVRFGGFQKAAGVVRVHTEQGMPVARAEVAVRRRSDSQNAWTHHDLLRTGADGRAEIRVLPPGEYCAFVSKLPPPFASWRNPLAEATSPDRYIKHFRVAPGDGQVPVDFAVGAGLELTGRFVMRDGGSLPGHGISLDALSTPDVEEFTGSLSFQVLPARLDNERFVFQGLSPGERYSLREFQGDHLKPFVIVGIRMNGTSLRGDDIMVADGAAAQTIDVVLDRSAVISGLVGSAAKTKSVTARRIAGDAPAALYPEITRTEVVGGRFVFRGLPAGTYAISVSGSEQAQQTEVKAGDIVEIEL